VEEGKGKVGELSGLRVGLVLVFFALSGLGMLASAGGPFQLGFTLAIICSAALLIRSLSAGNDGTFLWAWVIQVTLWLGVYPYLDPSANLLVVLALASASLVLLDVVHMMGLVYPMAVWKAAMTAEESGQIWRLLSTHLVRSSMLGLATFLSSVVILVFVFPLSLYTSPLLGTSVFAATALVLASLVVVERRGGPGRA
jgi:hypothetical protein